MTKVAFHTLGCKQNQFDTEALCFSFVQSGACEEVDPSQAEVLFLNTCAVTQKALAKARGEHNRLRRLYPGMKIITWGCGAAYQPDQFRAADDCAVGGKPFRSDQALTSQNIHPVISNRKAGELSRPHGLLPRGKTRALLRIQSGCNRDCAFCVVPRLRGEPRSVPLEECVLALQYLIAQGAPEIVLTGTNITLWGNDLPGNPTLGDLLKELVNHLGTARLRLSSLEPDGVAPEFLDWCLSQPNLCRHFHFAFQSGSPRVLQQMRRESTSPRLLDYLQDLSRQHPDVCLGSDLVVGFPGESEVEFNQTVAWIQDLPLSYLHVFPYSEREGTAAACFEEAVPHSLRHQRARFLGQLNQKLKKCFIDRNQNRTLDVISIRSTKRFTREGLTSNYLRINLTPSDGIQPTRFATRLKPQHRAVLVH